MSLFDQQPLTIEEVRQRLAPATQTLRKTVEQVLPGVVRKITRTQRHKPWWLSVGAGPNGATCQRCQFLTYNQATKRHYKCGKQRITRGPGTDIRLSDPACLFFIEKLVSQ